MKVQTAEGTPLAVLGFSTLEEELYRALLRGPATSLEELAPALGVTGRRLQTAFAALEKAGLAEQLDDKIVMMAPDIALTRLIGQETRRMRTARDQLDLLRGLVPELTAEHLSSQAPTGDPIIIERVEGGDVVQLVRGLMATSSGDLLWLRPDQWKYPPGREIDDWVIDLIRAGRRSRAIYPARVLEEAPHVVRERSEAGEHVRVLADVPCRVSIMGTTAALISEDFGVNDGRRLVVRQHSMIGALTLLFENLWERAMPVPGLDGLNGLSGGDRVSDRRLLLDQLAGGAKDEQIARALGLSLRTVRRRVADVLDELGVDSRFQAGVEAVRRGWL
jgi:DNA-binding transcriptional ArsR family regulator